MLIVDMLSAFADGFYVIYYLVYKGVARRFVSLHRSGLPPVYPAKRKSSRIFVRVLTAALIFARCWRFFFFAGLHIFFYQWKRWSAACSKAF